MNDSFMTRNEQCWMKNTRTSSPSYIMSIKLKELKKAIIDWKVGERTKFKSIVPSLCSKLEALDAIEVVISLFLFGNGDEIE